MLLSNMLSTLFEGKLVREERTGIIFIVVRNQHADFACGSAQIKTVPFVLESRGDIISIYWKEKVRFDQGEHF